MSFFIGNWGSHDSICALKSFDGHCPSKQCFCRSICCAMQFSDNNEISKKLTADRTDADTRTLLDVYEAERPKFMTRGLVCRKLWDEIAKKINSQRGRRFKGFHCENKWKVLLRSYRRAGRAKEKGNVNAEQFKRTHPLHERINSILTQEPSRDITVSIKERKPSRERRLQDVAQASKKAERGIGSCAESNSSPSVIHPKTVRTPNEFKSHWLQPENMRTDDIVQFSLPEARPRLKFERGDACDVVGNSRYLCSTDRFLTRPSHFRFFANLWFILPTLPSSRTQTIVSSAAPSS
ncbi:uncharacterized protein LOC111261225 isoform X2 [Varroa jacobsoni]|uniref:uncharacterized protein LOC111261225 isoform X2 n=1 Tax=Varroa jacobsoni TaxID=62625 RepID=UPI000BF85A91|nr:uncharacterized protein LOC111261225 isoform X2 [Varroa jacobsoni]